MGILEQIIETQAQHTQMFQQLAQMIQAGGGAAATTTAPPPPPPPPPANLLGVAGTEQLPACTAEQLSALVQRIVEKPGVRDRIKAEMAALGLGNLPDARPDQYPLLFQKFSAIEASLSTPAATPAAGGLSLI